MSVEISTIMTRLGYGEEMRHWRVEKYREFDRLANIFKHCDETVIIAGSKAEGLTCVLESDRDMLYVIEGVLCIEAGINLHTIPDVIDVFRMDQRVYPGHCRLLQERIPHKRLQIINDSLCDNGYEGVLLSSSLLLDEVSEPQPYQFESVVLHERAGPSRPLLLNHVFQIDKVTSLRCHCPSILKRWAARPRHWPSQVVVQRVASWDAYLTPVGFKGSEYKHMEWRICFNTGEAELVNNLNDTQAKVYVILKMILKDVLKPNNKEITSYVLKNIMLWQAENTPDTKFHAHSLLYWLHDGLGALRAAIETKIMCYYMIPERNLMEATSLQDKQKCKWVADITDMIAEGPRVILRLPKIRRAIVASPEPMLWFSKTRMELEMLYLENLNRAVQCTDENMDVNNSDFIIQAIWSRINEILKEVEQRMHHEGTFAYDLLARFFK